MTDGQIEDQYLSGYLLQLLECLEAEANKAPDPPKLFQLRPGAEIHLLASLNRDECCEGLAWIRPAGALTSSRFPDPDIAPNNCGPLGYAERIEIGIARCAPRPAANQLVDGATWEALTLTMLNDRATMRRAMCCWAQQNEDVQYLSQEWEPLPVEGGCYASRHFFLVQVPATCGSC